MEKTKAKTKEMRRMNPKTKETKQVVLAMTNLKATPARMSQAKGRRRAARATARRPRMPRLDRRKTRGKVLTTRHVTLKA